MPRSAPYVPGRRRARCPSPPARPDGVTLGVRRVVALLALALAAASCRRPLPPIDPPPGAADYTPELRAQLGKALASRGAGYRPRTRHLRPDGSPRWTNRLILESSPYLLQHAHNPVDWYPWRDEAFTR